MYHLWLIHSQISRHLGCFYFLTIMNNATIEHLSTNFCVGLYFISLGWNFWVMWLTPYLTWEIAKLFLKVTVPFFSLCILAQACYLPVFLVITILVDVKWYLNVLIFISLMASDVEHLFTCLLDICLLMVELWDFFIYSRYQTHVR